MPTIVVLPTATCSGTIKVDFTKSQIDAPGGDDSCVDAFGARALPQKTVGATVGPPFVDENSGDTYFYVVTTAL